MSLGEYKEMKYDYFFDFIDTAKKGYVTESNFIDNMIALNTMSHCAEKDYLNLRKEQLSWWALLIDIAAKNEGRVDRESFIQANFDFLKDGANRDSVKRLYAAIFKYIDQNKNGKICAEEFQLYYKSHNWTDESHILWIFEQLDLNKDGFVTRDEFINAGLLMLVLVQ